MAILYFLYSSLLHASYVHGKLAWLYYNVQQSMTGSNNDGIFTNLYFFVYACVVLYDHLKFRVANETFYWDKVVRKPRSPEIRTRIPSWIQDLTLANYKPLWRRTEFKFRLCNVKQLSSLYIKRVCPVKYMFVSPSRRMFSCNNIKRFQLPVGYMIL